MLAHLRLSRVVAVASPQFQRNPASLVGRVGPDADIEADFRHSGTTHTRSYGMDAAFMQLKGCGISTRQR